MGEGDGDTNEIGEGFVEVGWKEIGEGLGEEDGRKEMGEGDSDGGAWKEIGEDEAEGGWDK